MNAMSKIEDIRSQIALLSPDEKAGLITDIEYDLRKVSANLSRRELLVYDILLPHCKNPPPLGRLLETYGARKYKQRVSELYEYVDAARKFLRPPELAALLELCVNCLALDIQRRGSIPVTPATLLDSVSRIEIAVDDQFPGYADAGLLHRMVKKEVASAV